MTRYPGWRCWPDARAELRLRLPGATLDDVQRAVELADRWSQGERRRHRLRVLQIIIGTGMREADVLVGAVLHDVVVSGVCSVLETSRHFGPALAKLLVWLAPATDTLRDPLAARLGCLSHLQEAPLPAQQVALADWYATVQDLDAEHDPVARRRLHVATHTYLVPLAGQVATFEPLYVRWARRYPVDEPVADAAALSGSAGGQRGGGLTGD